jgi:hypothetical protein
VILKINKWVLFFVLVTLLQACGGGGGGDDDPSTDDGSTTNTTSNDYSGETKQATLTTENVEEISTAAASGSKQAVTSDGTTSLSAGTHRSDMPVTREQINEELSVVIASVLSGRNQLAGRGVDAARMEDLSDVMCDSGSVIFNYPESGLVGNWSIEFNQCARTATYGGNSYSTSFDGSVEVTYVEVGDGFSQTLEYIDFTTSVSNPHGSYSDTFNMSVTCTASNKLATDLSCEYYSDYHGYDNRTYRVSDITVSGNGSSGYRVSVRVYDPDHGYVTVTTEIPVAFECDGGTPSAGRITVEGAEGTSVVVEFSSCSEYVVTLDGVAETYSWP